MITVYGCGSPNVRKVTITRPAMQDVATGNRPHGGGIAHLPGRMKRVEARRGVQIGNGAMEMFVENDISHQSTETQETYDKLFWWENNGSEKDISPMVNTEMKKYLK